MADDPRPRPDVDVQRRRWRDGPATLGGWVLTHDPLLAEQMALAGFDEVTIDLQHGTIEMAGIASLCAAVIAGGALPLVRVPRADHVTIGRALDLGAGGVIVAMVESAAGAAAAVDACRYPPLGSRSTGSVRAHMTMGSLDHERLGEVICLVMIETAAGVTEVDAIAATPGLDGLYIGPGDLALSLGLPPRGKRSTEEERRFDDALDRILAAAHGAGITAGILAADGATGAALIARGFDMVTVAVDYGLIAAGARHELALARDA